jgi:phosphatidylserine/phosphatidylglycerophosphate/cardiolipin synthase-like enzyme
MTADRISVAVTGTDWMGGGIGSIESAMEQLFREARYEILLTVYAASSSADRLFEWLELALGRGVETKMVVNRLDEQQASVINQLYVLNRAYPHFRLYSFMAENTIDLHAKLIVADRQKAIVGSSNLSRRGFLTNYELALVLEGQTASTIAGAIDRLLSIPRVRMVAS